MKKRSFKINNWTRLDRTIEHKGNVLLSLFSILMMITGCIQVVIDFSNGLYIGVILDVCVVIISISTYILNENGKHILSGILFTSLLNLLILIFACIVPKENGVYLYFFSMISMAALIFNHKTRVLRNIFIGLPLFIITLLEVSEYQLLGRINIQEGIDDPYSFTINLIISLSITAFAIQQLMIINQKVDLKRIDITNELKSKNDALKKSNTELDHFVYSTSHDLKAPLSSISGLINIARHEVKEDIALEYFDMIDGRVDKLMLFIKDIIDLSRNSRLDLVKEDVNLTELVKNAIENNFFMENAMSIEFRTDTPKNNIFQLDKARIEVVLNNLISNAIKYHKKAGDRWIEISIKKLKSVLNIVIKDNGIGIEKSHHSKIFDMFYRGHESSDGSGLGLYIVEDVVKKMKGSITLSSELDVGTEIVIKIPLS